MRIILEKSKITNPELFIRRCGYGRMPSRGEVSYFRRLQATPYPRFHIYFKEEGDKAVINLHLDQKQPIYEGVKAHSGEYEGEVVEREAERIRSFCNF